MKVSEQLRSSWSVFDSVEAVRNWRALLLLAGTMTLATLCVVAFASSEVGRASFESERAMRGMALKMGLGLGVAFFILLYGVSAVGIMLFDAAKYQLRTGIASALLRSFASTHKLLIVLVLGVVQFLILVFICMMLLMMTKIPGIGQFMSFLLSPTSALALGVTCFALLYILFPFASVSVWSGENVLRTLAVLYAIFRKRFMTVVLQEIVLSFIVTIVFGIIFFMLATGTGIVAAIMPSMSDAQASGAMRGMDDGFGGMPGMGSGFGALLGLSGSMLAGASGIMMLYGIACVVPSLILIQGVCHIYIATIEGLDLVEAEATLKDGFAQAKMKLEQAKRAAEEAAAAARSQQSAPPAQVATGTASRKCTACGATVSAEDAFCGECGNKAQ